MAYASVQDWLDRNPHRGFVADYDHDGQADEAAVARALEDASAEMDGWLGGRHSTPITDPLAVPVLRQHCLVIATHILADTPQTNDQEIGGRYKRTLDFLKSIAKGDVTLPMQASTSGAGSASNVGVTFVTPERIFS